MLEKYIERVTSHDQSSEQWLLLLYLTLPEVESLKGGCCGAGGGGWDSRRQNMERLGTPWLELVFQAFRVNHLLSVT